MGGSESLSLSVGGDTSRCVMPLVKVWGVYSWVGPERSPHSNPHRGLHFMHRQILLTHWSLASSLQSCVHHPLAQLPLGFSHTDGWAFCTRDTVNHIQFLHVRDCILAAMKDGLRRILEEVADSVRLRIIGILSQAKSPSSNHSTENADLSSCFRIMMVFWFFQETKGEQLWWWIGRTMNRRFFSCWMIPHTQKASQGSITVSGEEDECHAPGVEEKRFHLGTALFSSSHFCWLNTTFVWPRQNPHPPQNNCFICAFHILPAFKTASLLAQLLVTQTLMSTTRQSLYPSYRRKSHHRRTS